MKEYIHHELGKDIRSISGYYTYLEQDRIKINGKDVLYVLGAGVIDNSCCGAGGCLFIEVPGYVTAWKSSLSADGRWISMVEPVTDENNKEDIRRALVKLHPHAQINF